MNKIKKAVAACAAIGIVAAASVCLSGCDSAVGVEASEYERLIYITSDFYESIRIVYAYDSSTGVMYIVSGTGGITPLYNPDGSLRIYTEG
jgi:hypothetical protein